MIYIYEFYDWNKSDHITHIKKIPLFKISSSSFLDIINNNVLFGISILDKIKNKTEVYTNYRTKVIEYAFLITDGFNVLGINIAENNLYTKLLLDEESDVLAVSKRLKDANIDYQIIGTRNNVLTKTRKESELENKVLYELKQIIKENNDDELKYLYYEFFNEKSSDLEKIKKDLYQKIISGDIINKFNDFLELKKCIKP